jgi:hypothetical protein
MYNVHAAKYHINIIEDISINHILLNGTLRGSFIEVWLY